MALDCLLINLTRFGDLIQSQSLIHDLTSQGLKVGLLGQDNFASTFALLDGLSNVWALPGARLLAQLDTNWQQALATLSQTLAPIKAEQPRIVLNLTASLPSRLLSLCLKAPTMLGFGMDKDGFGVNHSLWASFLAASSLCRHNAVFNIADMFRHMADPLGFAKKTPSIAIKEPEPQAFEQAHALLADATPYAPNGFIAFQLGASSATRQWPLSSFARVGDILWQKARICPVLTGSAQEKAFESEYQRFSHSPFVSALGKTSLPVLAALLRTVSLLLSNDTGTLHLASALNTKSASLFLATAQPFDTGPLREDCLCFEPHLPCHPCDFHTPCANDHACKSLIAPEDVAAILLAWIHGQSLAESVACAPTIQARVYATKRDPEGFASLRPLNAFARTPRYDWIRLQRAFWSHILDGQSSLPWIPIACASTLAKDFRQTLGQANTILEALCAQAPLLRHPQARTLFLRNADRLETLLSTHPLFVAFGYFWREIRMDMGGDIDNFVHFLHTFRLTLQRLTDHIEVGTNTA